MRQATYETGNLVEAGKDAIRKVRAYVPEGGIAGAPRQTRIEEPRDIDYGHSVWVGVAMGAVVGTVLGIGLLAYIDSPKLNHWGGAFSIPFWTACGWALFGMIVGSGGIFSEVGRKK